MLVYQKGILNVLPFSGLGASCITGGFDRRCILWDLRSGKQRSVLPARQHVGSPRSEVVGGGRKLRGQAITMGIIYELMGYKNYIMGNNEIISIWVCRNVIFSTERYPVPKMTISTNRREEIVSIFCAHLNFTMWLLLLCASEHALFPRSGRSSTSSPKKPRDDGRKGRDGRTLFRVPLEHCQHCVSALVSLPLSFGRRQLRILLVGVLFCISCFYCQMNMFKANDSENQIITLYHLIAQKLKNIYVDVKGSKTNKVTISSRKNSNDNSRSSSGSSTSSTTSSNSSRGWSRCSGSSSSSWSVPQF